MCNTDLWSIISFGLKVKNYILCLRQNPSDDDSDDVEFEIPNLVALPHNRFTLMRRKVLRVLQL